VFLAAQVAVVVALGTGVWVALEWAFAPASAGAGDAAAGVASLLTCVEQLLPQRREDVEIQVVVAGGGRLGAAGMRDVLDRHPEWRSERSVLVHFDRLGRGRLGYLRSESALERLEYPPRLRELARRLAEGGAYREISSADLVGRTDAGVAAARGLHALSLLSLASDAGAPEDDAGADVPEALDMETVVRAADFAAAIVVAGWRGESDPLAIV
jgi:hypothetical protein